MARPKLYEEKRVATAIRLPVSLRSELQEAASERDVSVNLLVTRAISEYLGRLPPSESQLKPETFAQDAGRRVADESGEAG